MWLYLLQSCWWSLRLALWQQQWEPGLWSSSGHAGGQPQTGHTNRSPCCLNLRRSPFFLQSGFGTVWQSQAAAPAGVVSLRHSAEGCSFCQSEYVSCCWHTTCKLVHGSTWWISRILLRFITFCTNRTLGGREHNFHDAALPSFFPSTQPRSVAHRCSCRLELQRPASCHLSLYS